jgi:hypothetical protein
LNTVVRRSGEREFLGWLSGRTVAGALANCGGEPEGWNRGCSHRVTASKRDAVVAIPAHDSIGRRSTDHEEIPMPQTLTRLYSTRAEAEDVVRQLGAAGVASGDISIIAPERPDARGVEDRSFVDRDRHPANAARAEEAAQDAGKGAVVGGVLGAGAGLLTGLGLLAIPGVGPVVAAGWLATTLGGAAVGAAAGGATGGIIGALTGAGVPEEDAHVYAEGVKRGGTLVSVRVSDAEAAEANRVLSGGAGYDAARLGEDYRRSGWTRFDESAPLDRPV